MNGERMLAFGRRVVDGVHTRALRSSFAAFGPRSVIGAPVRLGGAHRMHVGRDVYLGSNCWLETLDPEEGVERDGPVLVLADGVSIAGMAVVTAVESVVIGEAALIARGVYISDHSHRFDDPHVPIKDQGVTNVRPVVVGENSWLGENVVVTPGVRIGRGAVVGANSVVTRDVPDRTVAVGVPARTVRRLPT